MVASQQLFLCRLAFPQTMTVIFVACTSGSEILHHLGVILSHRRMTDHARFLLFLCILGCTESQRGAGQKSTQQNDRRKHNLRMHFLSPLLN